MTGDGAYTPPGRRPGKGVDGDDDGDNKLVVQQVKEAGVTLRYPMLSENNYGVWAVKMKIFMRAQGVWAAVVNKGGVDEKMDQMALAAIVQAVPEAVVMSISEHETAKEAWDAVATIHVSSDQVCKAKAQHLRREYEMIRFGPDETIDDFITHLSNLVATMGTVGETVEPSKVVWKFLRITPKKVREVAVAIEISLHISLTPITSIIYTLVILLMVNQSTVFPSHASLKYIGINSLLNQRSNICPKQTASH